MVLRRRGLLSIVIPTVAWLVTGCCDDCVCETCDEELPAPKVSSLDLSAGEIQVAPAVGPETGREFHLYGLYLDEDDNIISGRFDPLKWSLTPTSANAANNGLVSISSFPPAVPDKAVVKAEYPADASIFQQTTLTLWTGSGDAQSLNGGSDVVEASHTPLAIPEVALLEEKSNAGCKWANGVVFVGAAGVGEQNEKPCSIALFSGTHSLLYQSPATSARWSDVKGTVPLAPDMKEPLTVKIAIFIAVTGRSASALSGLKLTDTDQLTTDVAQAAESQAKVDVDWANLIFEANRVGLRIAVNQYKQLPPATTDLPAKVGADPVDCAAPRLLSATAATASWYDPTTISVYYVDWLDLPDDPLHPGSRGGQCGYWYSGEPGPVIFISYTNHSPATLAHEIGHALSLDHMDGRAANVMDGMANHGPLGASARSQFTLGQAFRMNTSDESWINKGPRTGAQRVCGIVGQCPPIDLDVR